jgi:protein TonB
MSHTSRHEAPERTPAGHVSVRLGCHPDGSPFLLERPQRRIPAAILFSLVVHAAVIGVAAGVYFSGATERGATVGRAALRTAVIWIPQPSKGDKNHGGGGGGDHTQPPPRRVELPGRDAVTVPVEKPRPVPLGPPASIPTDVAPPIAQLDISALRTVAGVETFPGALDGAGRTGSLGPGDGGGTGGGQGRGDGPGMGPGLGPGSGGNEGGGPTQPGTPGLRPPTVLREVKPIYTPEAMRSRIQGTATVECVVLPDGTVGDVQIVKSLDRTFGLDQEAAKAARKWLFQPGTVKGQPVAVLVWIEMTFALK